MFWRAVGEATAGALAWMEFTGASFFRTRLWMEFTTGASFFRTRLWMEFTTGASFFRTRLWMEFTTGASFFRTRLWIVFTGASWIGVTGVCVEKGTVERRSLSRRSLPEHLARRRSCSRPKSWISGPPLSTSRLRWPRSGAAPYSSPGFCARYASIEASIVFNKSLKTFHPTCMARW